ncbi:MAG TPA: heparan-alpha-glucosaminide N-acetyltransferase domain-containing protein [Panacibacter sp.]|nr:heparan-alpha-glucosaminide N-acetyltransferase domain-containing protein [Panacibacter sp.]HNP43794.1 heparan-alpha-glucosaminide N-acetyltransferase domain-containing protein [Panacibacter sp.]
MSNPSPARPTSRIQSIDILRGAVMLIMALDHARDFFHIHAFDDDPTNLATTTPLLFFTRIITHFCAPVFLLLSGTSAFLAGQKRTKSEQSIFLIKRGLWLVVVEFLVITLGWTFNPLYNVFIMQVIWAIGWSMVILGLLVRSSGTVIFITGLILFFGHNVLDFIQVPQQGTAGVLWTILFKASFTFLPIGENRGFLDVYAILPWTGVMLLGYSMGRFFLPSYGQSERRKVLAKLGLSLIALFVVLRYLNIYGDPKPWSVQKDGLYTFFSFINVTKYPVSLLYLCMTLGISLLVLAAIEKVQNKFTGILIIYGRVPFLYYVMHFYLMHLVAVVLFFATGHGANEIVDPQLPFLFRPMHYGYDLWVVYAVWLFVIVVLYWPCKWFNKYRSTHRQWWLSYV